MAQGHAIQYIKIDVCFVLFVCLICLLLHQDLGDRGVGEGGGAGNNLK
jgi:hypothetical protein